MSICLIDICPDIETKPPVPKYCDLTEVEKFSYKEPVLIDCTWDPISVDLQNPAIWEQAKADGLVVPFPAGRFVPSALTETTVQIRDCNNKNARINRSYPFDVFSACLTKDGTDCEFWDDLDARSKFGGYRVALLDCNNRISLPKDQLTKIAAGDTNAIGGVGYPISLTRTPQIVDNGGIKEWSTGFTISYEGVLCWSLLPGVSPAISC